MLHLRSHLAFEPVRWVSDEVWSIVDCGVTYTETWWGDAATYLTRVGGDLAAGGGAIVTQSSHEETPSQLLATSACNTPNTVVYGAARSLFFGKPHTQDLPQFWGPNGQRKTYTLAGYYYAQSNTQATVDMAPAD